ncbi:MAG: PAS domain-containing protein [Clostridiales Family XIII bacterium]|jgi:two-component system phosphate regulon sensor histidine kinase PhoR|nr:PAS domain-containing protein [Clostridiales Family XIII bacterium]
MKRSILIFACALTGFSIILTALLIHLAAYWGFSERIKREAVLELGYLRAAVELSGPEYLEALRPGATDPRISLIAADGTVLYDSAGMAAEMENHADRPEVKAALAEGSGESTRFSETIRKQTYYHAIRLNDGSVLRTAGTTDSVFASLGWMILLTLAIIAAVFCAAAWMSSRAAQRIVAPLSRLNLDLPEDDAAYMELSPLLAGIKRQNDRIAEQLAEMRKKQLEFSAVSESMREGLIVLDGEARVVSCNRSALNLLHTHFTGAENVLKLRRDEPFRRVVEQALKGEPSETMLSADGRHIQLIANPIADGGELHGAVLMLLDVTEREDREKLRREFSANVSHELKTPLTAISGYAEILSNGVAGEEDTPRFARIIYAEAQRLIALTNDILMLSNLDEGGQELLKERIDLRTCAEETARRFGDAAGKRNVSVLFDGENAEIVGIRRVLDEMLSNLLDNAVKYSADGGTVRVSVKNTPDGILLSVADTGIGIPREEQERVFERFYRAEKSRNKAAGGTGLGLSIVKHGALLHEAKIELQSEEQKGTRISLLFPDGATSEMQG